jgi:hypothetical protein
MLKQTKIMTDIKKLINKPMVKLGLIIVLAISHVFLLYKARVWQMLNGQAKLLDFENYLLLAKATLQGKDPYQLKNIAMTLGPPPVILFYIPFSLFPTLVANQLITLISLASLYFSIWLLINKTNQLKNFKLKDKLIIFLSLSSLVLGSFPARFNLGMGQPNLIIAALVALMLVTQNKFKQTLLIIVSAIIKTFYGFAILSRLNSIKKNLIKLILIGIGFTLVSFLMIKPQVYKHYFKTHFLGIMSKKTAVQEKTLDYYNQSLGSTLTRFNLEQLYLPIWIGLLGIISWLVMKNKNKKSLMLAITGSLLISPIVWQHYFVVLFPILIYILVKYRLKVCQLILYIAGSLLIWLQISSLHPRPPTLINAILASHFFFGLIMIFVLIASLSTQRNNEA